MDVVDVVRPPFATGSPTPPVQHAGREHAIAQCNNTYVFPAIGLAVHSVSGCRVTDGMLRAASRELGRLSPARETLGAPLLPPIEEIRSVSIDLAVRIAEKALEQSCASGPTGDALRETITTRFWEPAYDA